MGSPLISLDTVREIMTSWMTQYIEEWTNEGSRWNYESAAGDFTWYKYSKADSEQFGYGPCWHAYKITSEGLSVGARLANQGETIVIWTGENDNDNIIIYEDDIIFNDNSDFGKEFSHGKMYYLYTKLKSHALSGSADPGWYKLYKLIEEENMKKSVKTPKGVVVRTKFDLDYFKLYNAYAVYDEAGECRHCILTNANENMLKFIYYYKDEPTWEIQNKVISVSVDDYLHGKFKIKPLVENEQ